MHMQAGQCSSQMGTTFWKVVSNEHGIGSDGEYFGTNDLQLGRINVLCHEASGGKYFPRAVLFDIKSGVISAVHALPLSELFRPSNLVNHKS
jgi:hypothetical protein